MGVAYLFLDANVFLHFNWQAMPWSEIGGADEVFLVVPYPVLKALDRYKYDARLKDRATTALRRLDLAIEKDDFEFRPGVRFHLLHEMPKVFEAVGLDRDVPDDQIIAAILEFAPPGAPGSATLVAADRGIRLKAKVHKIAYRAPSEDHELPPPEDATQAKLRRERDALLERINRSPRMVLSFDGGSDRLRVTLSPKSHLTEAQMQEVLQKERDDKYFDPGELKVTVLAGNNEPVADEEEVSEEEIAAERSRFDAHLSELRKFVEAESKRSTTESLYFPISLRLRNAGGGVASDVDVRFSVPDTIALVNEIELPNVPDRPDWISSGVEAHLQRTLARLDFMGGREFGGLASIQSFEYTFSPHFDEKASVWIAKDIRAGEHLELTLFGKFARPEDVKSFDVGFEVLSKESAPATGTLHVVVEIA